MCAGHVLHTLYHAAEFAENTNGPKVKLQRCADAAAKGTNSCQTQLLVAAQRVPRSASGACLTSSWEPGNCCCMPHRNVTLMAPPGLMPLLDVQFKRSEVGGSARRLVALISSSPSSYIVPARANAKKQQTNPGTEHVLICAAPM